jgi:hypothetical protein
MTNFVIFTLHDKLLGQQLQGRCDGKACKACGRDER